MIAVPPGLALTRTRDGSSLAVISPSPVFTVISSWRTRRACRPRGSALNRSFSDADAFAAVTFSNGYTLSDTLSARPTCEIDVISRLIDSKSESLASTISDEPAGSAATDTGPLNPPGFRADARPTWRSVESTRGAICDASAVAGSVTTCTLVGSVGICFSSSPTSSARRSVIRGDARITSEFVDGSTAIVTVSCSGPSVGGAAFGVADFVAACSSAALSATGLSFAGGSGDACPRDAPSGSTAPITSHAHAGRPACAPSIALVFTALAGSREAPATLAIRVALVLSSAGFMLCGFLPPLGPGLGLSPSGFSPPLPSFC